eukprot:SAG31_NODE_5063_length_2763_cov_8.216967_1_plen_57_part_10
MRRTEERLNVGELAEDVVVLGRDFELARHAARPRPGLPVLHLRGSVRTIGWRGRAES